MGPLTIHAMHGSESPEKASLALLAGLRAREADRPVTVLLTADAVWLAVAGYGAEVSYAGHPPLEALIRQLLRAGATVAVNRDSARARSLADDALICGITTIDCNELLAADHSGQSLTY